VAEKVALVGLTNYPILTKTNYNQWALLIGKESIEGELDDIFFKTNKNEKKENRNHDQLSPLRGLLKNKKEESYGNSRE
jgi:hypothetical protein